MFIKVDYFTSMLLAECSAHDFSILRINKNEVSIYRTVTGYNTIRFLYGIRMIKLGKSGRYMFPHLHETAGIKDICNLADHSSFLVFRFYLHNDLLVSITFSINDYFNFIITLIYNQIEIV